MPKSCVAYNCTNRFLKGNGISFHRFPFSRKDVFDQWITALRREGFYPTIHDYICSEHFTAESFYDNYVSRRILKENAVPSIFDFPKHLKKIQKPRKQPKERVPENSSALIIEISDDFQQICASNKEVEHNYFVQDSPKKLKRKYEELLEKKNEELSLLRKKLKVAKLKNARKTVRIKSLTDIVKNLKSKNFLNSKLAETFEENFSEMSINILKRKSKSTKSYNDELKSFALSLFFYSPKAYDYVRNSLMLTLPHPCTLRRWYNVINGDPGFTGEALSALKERLNEVNYDVYFSLIFDEMSIRKHIDWDGKEFFGYATFGSKICSDQLSEAKGVLAFMIVGLNVFWSMPIAYYLVNSVTAEEKACLVTQAILILHDLGANVCSLTFDGTSTNFATAEILGAQVHDPLNIKSYFTHPSDESKNVYITPDACHMIKLMRNVFADLVLVDGENRIIKWSYIQHLNILQNEEGLHLANKLKMSHIHFYQNKMKVSFAVQVFSQSVAEALQFVSHGLKLKQFQDCDGTVKFILLLNNLFDICNSKNPITKGSKAAIKLCNKSYWEPFLQIAEEYLLNLKVLKSGKFLFQTPRKTPIIGFLCLIRSLQGLFGDLVLKEKLKYILTYKLSQDHVEMFFSRIRQKGGWNNNPSAVQFRAAYKQLLVKNDIRASLNANCKQQDSTKYLPCFSVLPCVAESIFNNVTAQRLYNFMPSPDTENDDVENIEEYFQVSSHLFSEYCNNIIVYIAGFVVKKLLKKIICPDCSLALLDESESLDNSMFLFQKDKGGLKRPSQDVVSVCTFSEKFIRAELSASDGKLPPGNVKQRITTKVLKCILSKPIFTNLSLHALESLLPENHILSLVKAITGEFLNLRFHHLTKIKNINLKGQNIRQKLTKIVLFKNQ